MTYEKQDELGKLLGLLFIVAFCVWIGYGIGQGQTRGEAARNGVGAFVVKSSDSPTTIWQWNSQTNK